MKYVVSTVVLMIILLITFFTYVLPAIKADEFVHPLRIDTPYVERNLNLISRGIELASLDTNLIFCNPAELNLAYKELNIETDTGLFLHGWHILPPACCKELPGLLILHDLNKSKLNELVKARDFANRGFQVFLFDLRAHGLSGGDICTFGYKERFDISRLIDSLSARTDVNRFAILGTGLGGNVAFQAAGLNPKIQALVLQNIAPDLNRFLKYKLRSSNRKFYSPVIRSIRSWLPEKLLKEKGSDTLKNITLPIYFIGDKYDNYRLSFETGRSADSSASQNKQVWFPSYNVLYDKDGINPEYFDRIAKFISSVSSKGRKTRLKRFAYRFPE